MKSDSQTGYLIIADISGYTAYVAKTEIQNAQALLAELLTRIVERFEPLVKISRLEGDAVFAFSSSTPPLHGETLMDLLESTYVAFREGQELYRRTLCDCEACRSLPMLELKFIVHHGAYAIQKVGEHRELIGSDVNLAHRLLKNHVTETTGWRAYALITDSALLQMGLRLDGAQQGTERYDHLGETDTHIFDLTPRYQAWIQSRQVAVSSQDSDMALSASTVLPPHEVWKYLNDPAYRTEWEPIQTIRGFEGRPEIGKQSLCVNGNTKFAEILLDWKPFDTFSVARVLTIGGRKATFIQALTTFQLTPTPKGGTNLQIFSKVQSTLPGWLVRYLARYILRYLKLGPAYVDLANLLAGAQLNSALRET